LNNDTTIVENFNKQVKITIPSQQSQSKSSNSQAINKNLNNILNNSNNGININKGLVNKKIGKKNISSGVETPVDSEIHKLELNEVKSPILNDFTNDNNSVQPKINEIHVTKNEDINIESSINEIHRDNNENKEKGGLFNWITSLFGVKNKKNINVDIKKEEKMKEQTHENNKEVKMNVNNKDINDNTNTTPNINMNVESNPDTKEPINSINENNNINEQTISSDIIVKQNNKKYNLKLSMKNLKNWFNKKVHTKKKDQLKTLENGELIDIDNDMNNFAIESELRDILNDNTVGSVENIIYSATKGIILPKKNPLSKPPVDTMNYIFNKICHRINQYFFPRSEKIDESKLTGILKLVNRYTKTSFDVRRIAIIGVHGWFPSRSIQKMVGDPTGTSEKFCQEMTYNVITYFNDLGIEITNENISQIPLSGEGIVKNRVEALYEQLEKRMDEVRNADIVLFSAHSQGTPVSVFLLNRLLENKEIDTERQTVGMLAMAGIHHGPFPIMRENFIVKFVFSSNSNNENDVSGDAGEELFVFNDPHEQITKYYHAALFNVLNSGVRICAIGSWFDQVVPLYSATLQGINHPNLYRAIYVERRDYHDDFFTSLIEFDMKLRNRGISDYGLLIHLSDLIIGSFVHGTQGHSTIYESDNVYKLLLSWITTSKASTKRLPYSEFFDPKQLCGIEDDKEEESFSFEPLTYTKSTTTTNTNTNTTSTTDTQNIHAIPSNTTTTATTTTTTTTTTTATSASTKNNIPSSSPPPQISDSKVEQQQQQQQQKSKEIPKLESQSSTPNNDTDVSTTTNTNNISSSTSSISNIKFVHPHPHQKLTTPSSNQKKESEAPPKMVMGMRMSKFKALHKLDVILEQLQSMHIHRFKSPKTLNTYYIPWIISNLQHSNKIKDDPELLDDLKHLMIQYSEWHPTSKSLKLLKERLAPIQELFKVADINITPEDIKRIKEAKAKQQQQQQQQYYSQYESPYDPPFSSSTSSSSSSSTTTTTTTTTTTAEKVPYNDQEAIHEINDILFRGEEDEEE
jgi:hypothetical protein